MASLSDYYRQRQQPQQPEAPVPPLDSEPAAETTPHAAGPFKLDLPEGWRDQTLYVFAGPLDDGVQHTVTVGLDPEPGEGGLDGFVDRQIGVLEEQLKAFEVVSREPVTLQDETAAVRAVFSWHPVEGTHIVQEQLYVLHETTAYTLTATFSPETFETRGLEVRALLLSFVAV